MKTIKTYGVMRPDGLEVGLRKDLDGSERLACLWIQSPSRQQGTVGAWLNVTEAKKLIGWLDRFVEDHQPTKR
jgi:hypothetical protein